jgi:hypothetical protein
MGRTRDTRLRRVAVHEAGHAVAAVRFHHGLRRATVEPGEDSLGHILANLLPRSVRRALELEWPTPAQRRRVEGFLTMLLAGPAAERRLTGRWNHVHAGQDYADAAYVAMRASRDEADMDRQLEAAEDRGVAFADEHWFEIEAVAAALAERGTLTGREVRAIVGALPREPRGLRDS